MWSTAIWKTQSRWSSCAEYLFLAITVPCSLSFAYYLRHPDASHILLLRVTGLERSHSLTSLNLSHNSLALLFCYLLNLSVHVLLYVPSLGHSSPRSTHACYHRHQSSMYSFQFQQQDPLIFRACVWACLSGRRCRSSSLLLIRPSLWLERSGLISPTTSRHIAYGSMQQGTTMSSQRTFL